jgi:uncharacterized protein YjbJ (UPF0337 family)
MLPVCEARHDHPVQVRQERVERLAPLRRVHRQRGADVAGGDLGGDWKRLDPLVVVRDPVDHLAAVPPELLVRHVHAATVPRGCGLRPMGTYRVPAPGREAAGRRPTSWHGGAGIRPPGEERTMAARDKVRGKAKATTGRAKRRVGHATGNTRLVREGWTQQVTGNLRQAVEKVKDAFRR